MRRPVAALSALLVAGSLALTACGSDESSTEEKKPTTIAVTIADGKVDPNGERIKVGKGAPVTFVINSDKEGEMHIHSTPEQSVEYGVGETTATVTLDQAKLIDVELHDPAMTVVQLEVR